MATQITEPSDEELIERIARQDRAAFDLFYKRHEKHIYFFIQKKLNDSFEAYDILHEVFMEIWRKADRFEGRSKVSTWFFGIAFNKTVDRIRKKMPDQFSEDDNEDIVDEEVLNPMELVGATEEATLIAKCIEALKATQRAVVQLAFYEDMSYPEIAKIIGRPEGTVKTRIFHAKQALKLCISKFTGDRS
ncbi:MAG: sigma-70 family RNA polymerase sigma factor [Sneathiella sp.]|nr:sigma-70 family RNA polymerase sigma factor [Sneathiella sp.]